MVRSKAIVSRAVMLNLIVENSRGAQVDTLVEFPGTHFQPLGAIHAHYREASRVDFRELGGSLIPVAGILIVVSVWVEGGIVNQFLTEPLRGDVRPGVLVKQDDVDAHGLNLGNGIA